MNIPSLRGASLGVILLTMASLALPACTIHKEGEGENKKVDIETPVGGLHVGKDADAKEVGLSVYPGARLKQKSDDGEEKSANLSFSTDAFGLKVVAIEYESDDSPDKILNYYSNELKKYGKVVQCKGDGVSASIHSESGSEELTCEDSKGSGTELKAGNKANQHLVSVKPRDKGSDFALVYIRTRGKDTI